MQIGPGPERAGSFHFETVVSEKSVARKNGAKRAIMGSNAAFCDVANFTISQPANKKHDAKHNETQVTKSQVLGLQQVCQHPI